MPPGKVVACATWCHGPGGGVFENICTGMLKVDFGVLTISIPAYCKKKKEKEKKKKKIPDHFYNRPTSLVTKPTHLYTIFTEMMTHHFHQQNSPSSYHHRNKGSLIYLKQFQNHPIGIPKLMKMHLKTFEHPRTPFFRETPPGATVGTWNMEKKLIGISRSTGKICYLG